MYMPTALADPKITYTHSPCICLPLWPTLNLHTLIHYVYAYLPLSPTLKLRTLIHHVYAYRSGQP